MSNETYKRILCTGKKNKTYMTRDLALAGRHCKDAYGVAWVSRIDKIIRLFCKRALQKRQYSAKETYNLIDPAHCSHPIVGVEMESHWTHVKWDVFTCQMRRIHMSNETYSHAKWDVFTCQLRRIHEPYWHERRHTHKWIGVGREVLQWCNNVLWQCNSVL